MIFQKPYSTKLSVCEFQNTVLAKVENFGIFLSLKAKYVTSN
jgi:hypothetical protein